MQYAPDSLPKTADPLRRQRRFVQALFVFVNLVLVDARVTGWLWAAIGIVFWITVIGVTIANGPTVCSWVCWLGTAQDWAEPLAKRRWRLHPTFWRVFVLILAIVWAPFLWLIHPEVLGSVVAPFGIGYGSMHAHLLQLIFFVIIGLSVMVLGKRGACIYFCPLLLITRIARTKQLFTSLRRSLHFSRILGKAADRPAAGLHASLPKAPPVAENEELH